MAARNKSNVISITRVYDAPLKAVWEAWTVPAEIAQWWGPRGFTLTTHSRDLRTGGHWHYTMHGPDGTDYENTTHYLEVAPMQRMVYDHGGHKDRPPLFRVTALFTALGQRTQLDLSFALETTQAAQEMRSFIRKVGGESTWDRLAEYLDGRHAGKERFYIARSFEASIERVYEAWTDPAHLARWLPPTGATLRFLRTEPRVGGSSFYEMTAADGKVMHGLMRFHALEKPHRIEYSQQFCDADERVIRPPFFSHWPLAMHSTVLLAAEGPDCTRVTVCWEPRDATEADMAEFIRQRGGMTMGWSGSFDKLEAMLA